MAERLDPGIDGLSDFMVIGSGGFSTVYKAWDDGFSRPVAVKLLHSLDEDGRRRFERERSLLGRLSSHPNVITPFRSGYTDDDTPYLVMEHVAGGSLQELIDERSPVGWMEAIDLLAPIGDALGHGHQRRVLHRDVKPANILLSSGGVPKLADYGIASLREAPTTQLAYTVAHSPPETFAEGHDRRDERSDLYSLASTLFTLLAGHPPYVGDGSDSAGAVMRRIEQDPVPELDNVPAELGRFLTRALAKNPDDRPATAEEFTEQLRSLRAAAEPGNGPDPASTVRSARPPTNQATPGPTGRELAADASPPSGRRRPKPTEVALVGAVLAVAALGLVLWQTGLFSPGGQDTAAADGALDVIDEPDAGESDADGDQAEDTSETTSAEEQPIGTDRGEPSEPELLRATYDFETGPQGWAASSDPNECPEADVSVLDGVGREGSNALAWTLPSPFVDRCTVEVNIVGSPPDGPDLDELDRTDLDVGCFVSVPPELRGGSLDYFERQYFGIWSLDDGAQHQHFGPEILPDEESPDWIQIDMQPGRADYRTISRSIAPRDPDFGALETYRIWVLSETTIELSGPVLLDDCWVATS